jgi:peptidoglycan/LPS O-acetylase OafA/YrhL
MPRSVAIAVAVLAIPLFLFVEHNGLLKIPGLLYRPVAWGMPAFLLVWAALSLERETKESKMFGLLGDASYSLYLVHGFVAPLFLFFWMRAGLDQTVNIWIYLACYLLVCHVAGISAHLFIEKPLNTAIRKYTRAKPKCVTS